MFSKANALWKDGKERSVKMYWRRGLQLPTLRMVCQLRMIGHNGCATMTMEVVRWFYSRKHPNLPEP